VVVRAVLQITIDGGAFAVRPIRTLARLRTLVFVVAIAALALWVAEIWRRSKLTGQPPRGSIRFARLAYDEGWNVNPQAIPHLMVAMQKTHGFNVFYQEGLHLRNPNMIYFSMLYMHGAGSFSVAPGDLAALRQHLDPGGGMIFADAACGSALFDAAFRRFAAALFPNIPLVSIPSNDELYAMGANLSNVRYTDGAGGRKGFPQLEGIKVDGHWAIIYSKYGIGCAMEGDHDPRCKGYMHDDSLKTGELVYLYSTLP
jgi:Domain of unknown function (DUF4159)